MAVRLEVTLTGLRVQFSGADLVAACSRGLVLPFNRILGVRVMARADAVASSPRLPCPGLWWSQRYRAGCWGIGERRQLWSARQSAQVVVIYLTGRPFHRVVVDVDEPERAHRQIDAALLHSKKTSARRSLRNHEPSITNHPALDPACAEQRPQRRRPPRQDVARVPPRGAARRRRAKSRSQQRAGKARPEPGLAPANPSHTSAAPQDTVELTGGTRQTTTTSAPLSSRRRTRSTRAWPRGCACTNTTHVRAPGTATRFRPPPA